MIPQDRQLKCSVRPDKKIAIFHKTDKLRAFVVTKEDLSAILKNARHKNDLTDPCLNSPFGNMEITRVLGMFTIDATRPTLAKILKMLKPYEVQ